MSYETFLSEAHVSDGKECFKVASDNVWLLDSGANTYMSKNEKLFTTLSSEVSGEVIVANSARIKIEGSGTVMLKFGNRNFQLENVSYVPGLKVNLISVKKIAEKGNKVMFENNVCKIYNRHGELIGGQPTKRSVSVDMQRSYGSACVKRM